MICCPEAWPWDGMVHTIARWRRSVSLEKQGLRVNQAAEGAEDQHDGQHLKGYNKDTSSLGSAVGAEMNFCEYNYRNQSDSVQVTPGHSLHNRVFVICVFYCVFYYYYYFLLYVQTINNTSIGSRVILFFLL